MDLVDQPLPFFVANVEFQKLQAQKREINHVT